MNFIQAALQGMDWKMDKYTILTISWLHLLRETQKNTRPHLVQELLATASGYSPAES